MRLPFSRDRRAREVAPKFAVADLGGGEAEVVLYGDVMEDEPRDFWTGEPTGEPAISTERFNRELDAIRGARHVTVRLNSCGGDVYSGLAIYSALRSLGARITVRVEGIAASAASVIACAGDEVIVHPGSIYMVHEAAVGLMGYYQLADIDALRKDLEATNKSLLGVYEERTGRDAEELAALMAEETWMVGSEIVDAGFATAIETGAEGEGADDEEPAEGEPEQVEEEPDGSVIVAGVRHDLSAYRNVPTDLAARVAASEAACGPRMAASTTRVPTRDNAGVHSPQPPQAAEEKGAAMTVAELRAQCPELVAEIETAAAEAERARLADIDRIAGDIPADMVAAAKYKEPCTAQELAYRALSARSEEASASRAADAAGRAGFAAALAEDAEESGADMVAAAPNSGTEPEIDETAETRAEVSRMAEVYKQMKGAL